MFVSCIIAIPVIFMQSGRMIHGYFNRDEFRSQQVQGVASVRHRAFLCDGSYCMSLVVITG